MGRTVSTPLEAIVAYTALDEVDVYGQDEFDLYVAELQEQICTRYPSMQDEDNYLGTENHVLASNGFAVAGVSEYMGLVAVWLAPREVEPEEEGLRDEWLARVGPGFKKTFGTLLKTSTASNGEAMFMAAQ